jgi:pSer/pThr/pTyr-binding forkhead associated (FHA) protein
MPLRLRVIPFAGSNAGEGRSPTTERTVEFPDDVEEIRIGRRTDVDLSLPFPALSGVHARLLRKRAGNGGNDPAWMLEDLDSKNGTFVSGVRLKPGEQRLIRAGNEVELAHVRLVFDGPSRPVSGAEGTATIARRLVNDLFLASPDTNAPTLTVVTGTANVGSLKLSQRDRPYLVGRSKRCDLHLKVEELSREHASFTRGSNGVVLRDLESKNGVSVNGVKVREQRLADGDLVQMGPLKVRLFDPEDRYLRDLEANQERAAAADRPPPAVAMPSAPPPVAKPPTPIAPSRLARPASAVRQSEPRAVLDEFHPAISPRMRADPFEKKRTGEHPLLRRARTAQLVAAAVLAAIAAVLFLIALSD